MEYRRCGHSGVLLPAISLGLWHNFGDCDNFVTARDMIVHAFDNGICHFDLANNYGPTFGSAERNFGRILRENLATHRDEMFISSKAGHEMWPGVYGNNSSRKNLIASCNASLQRTGLEYFDVFYSHRYDGVTPVEETMQALIDIVRSGKALYAGISKYPPELQRKCYEILAEAKVPCLVSQYRASMLDRTSLSDNIPLAAEYGSGVTVFSPLAQGLLTDRYLNGIPSDSRAGRAGTFLKAEQVNEDVMFKVRQLNDIAKEQGMTLAQMAIAWLLANPAVSSVIVGASSVAQLSKNMSAAELPALGQDTLERIESVLSVLNP